jgi:hypothetical protein
MHSSCDNKGRGSNTAKRKAEVDNQVPWDLKNGPLHDLQLYLDLSLLLGRYTD